MVFQKPSITCEWLSSKSWQRELVVWIYWTCIISGSLVAINVGIWPLAIHLAISGIVITFAFRKIVNHKYAKKDFEVNQKIFKP